MVFFISKILIGVCLLILGYCALLIYQIANSDKKRNRQKHKDDWDNF